MFDMSVAIAVLVYCTLTLSPAMSVFFLVAICVAYAQSFRIPVIQLERITPCQRLIYSILIHCSCLILRVERHYQTLLEGGMYDPWSMETLFKPWAIPVMPRSSLQ